MDIVLPREIAYAPSLPALPECTNTEIVAAPVNGGSFGPGQLIQFDLISKGMLDPSSLYCWLIVMVGSKFYNFFSSLKCKL